MTSLSSKPTTAPAAPFDLRKLALRLGIPLLLVWGIAIFARHWIVWIVAAVLTVAIGGLLVFTFRMMRKTQRVRSLVTEASTAQEREEAIQKIDQEFKKGDVAAVFAKAQLRMQENPRAALAELESIDVQKTLPNVADEVRAQRAMLHLLLDEPDKARVLVDAIELSRHQDTKAKAMLASIVCEAWARTGQASRALDILQLFEINDPQLVEVKPGLLRAQVFAFGATNDLKQARGSMHQLAKIDPRVIAGFAQRGVHPLLVQEAKKILERAGLLPQMQMQRPTQRYR